MQSFAELEKWIQPQYLEQTAIERIRNSSEQAFKFGLILDDFFHHKYIEFFQHLLNEEALFKKHFKIFGDHAPVSEEVFWNVPEEKRFLSRRYVCGVKPDYKMSPNWLTYLKFEQFYKQYFANYLDAITGYELEINGSYTHSHQFEHFLKPHNDLTSATIRPRRLCTVYYMTRDWESAYGGDLKMLLPDGSEKTIEAKCNRIVLFNPNHDCKHYVTRHTEIARDKTRTCRVAWYRDRV